MTFEEIYSRVVDFVVHWNKSHIARPSRSVLFGFCLSVDPDMTIRTYREVLAKLYFDCFIDFMFVIEVC